MRIAVLSPGYPTEVEPYNYAFVHARCRLYQAAGNDVAAFVVGSPDTFELDSVPVRIGPVAAVTAAIQAFRPDVLAVHAPNFRSIPVARRIEAPQLSWIHGHEILFSLRGVTFGRTPWERAKKWVKVIPRNLVQIATIRDFLVVQERVVFVSRWMQEAAQRHSLRCYPNGVVIPNPIDTDAFAYCLREENLLKGVTARGLNNDKYGIDVAIRAFAGLDEASLTIFGRGTLAPAYQRLIRRTRANATLVTRVVAHRDMPALFAAYGFFVAPSRVEAQGVAMCEAMACGLPVVATRVGGIPEFVDDGVEGFLVPSERPRALREAVRALVADGDRYRELSRNARARMVRQCGQAVVTRQELQIMHEAGGHRQRAHSSSGAPDGR